MGEIKIYDKMPKGWKRLKGAQTARRGYEWICNGKSRFGGEYRHALLKIE
jgi:hypothetical protein